MQKFLGKLNCRGNSCIYSIGQLMRCRNILIYMQFNSDKSIGLDKKNQHQIVNIFLSIIFSICFGCSKKRRIVTVLLSTHNICFWLRNKKKIWYILLTKGPEKSECL